MGLRHWSYAAMLLFCLAGTLPLVPAYRLRVLHHVGRLALAVVLAGAPFLAWDVWATHVGHWHFDAAQTLPWRVAGLPYEEVAFFVVIPLVSILAYEGVLAAVRRRSARTADQASARGRA
jgi:lycopene cyclase domain-containing protein